MYADVIVDISVEALDKTYQYHIPEMLESSVTTGTPVKVPFGKGNRVLNGFVNKCKKNNIFCKKRLKKSERKR